MGRRALGGSDGEKQKDVKDEAASAVKWIKENDVMVRFHDNFLNLYN